MKTTSPVCSRTTWPSSPCCAPWAPHNKMQPDIKEESKMASPTLETEEMIEPEKNPGQSEGEHEATTPLVKPAVEHSDTGAGEAVKPKRNGLVGVLTQHPPVAGGV